MRKLIATTMVSLDGVMQAPGGPEEDPTGGGHLIQTLQVAGLINEFNVWTFPVVLGRGKRLFEAGAKPGALRLVASQTSTTGVVMSTYVAAGDVPHGSFVQDEPSAKEVQRRAKLARGGGDVATGATVSWRHPGLRDRACGERK